MSKLGFIGLGIMGTPMALRLKAGGHDLFIHTRSEPKPEVLAAGAVQLYAKRFALFSACVCLALLGLGLEYAQGALTSTRLRDGGDALANTLGVLVGLATQFTPWRDALLRFDTRR